MIIVIARQSVLHCSCYFSVNYIEGIHSDFEQLISWMQFNNNEDFQKYLSRLKAVPNRVIILSMHLHLCTLYLLNSVCY